MDVGINGVLGARFAPKGAELLLLIISNPFEYGLACIAPLGRREGADLVREQGTWKNEKRCVDDKAKLTLCLSDKKRC